MCVYMHAYMDFPDGEIRIVGTCLDFSIGEIQAVTQNTDFSIEEIQAVANNKDFPIGAIHIWMRICTYLDSMCMNAW